ncbi:MAG: hypothetical protein M1830_001156 [Pleopsidium flavum]|nr:MAG: hypothetical protein M1830_001156 [Pleopsidium flavum]
MTFEPNLGHALSMHPHPFHLHSDRSEASTPIPEMNITSKRGASTSFEPTAPPFDENDPISRHSTVQSSRHEDVEGRQPLRYTCENDPYRLSSKLKSMSEIDQIRANSSRRRDGCGPIIVTKKAHKAKKLQVFYESQNENIERLLKPVDEHVRQAKEFDGENLLKFKIAVHGSFAANIALAVLQLYGAIASGSLSLFTTMADAVFDPMSNVTLIACNRAVKSVDPRRFPSGKARIETAGNIVFCFLMTAVSFILIVLSARDLVEGSTSATTALHLPSVIAVSVAFFTKLALFFYCWSLRNVYSQIRILWEDHRNDLIINGFGILTSVGGSKLKWWIDPMGAIILACLIATLWLRTAYSEFQLLIGVTADIKIQQWITYIAMTHSPMITAIDTVRAYHSGPRIIVEVDIVMDPNETLRATHDVAEELQTKLERMPDVERAYVHIDYETSHKPEHFLKKEL